MNELVKEFDELEADSNFISAKSAEFTQKYARKFVAVKDRHIIAVGSDFEKLIKEIKQKGFEPSQVLVQYIPSKNEIVLY